MKPLKNTQGVEPMPQWMSDMLTQQPHTVIQEAIDRGRENSLTYPDGDSIPASEALKYFGQLKGDEILGQTIKNLTSKRIKINDLRTVDQPSGLPVSDKKRVGGNVPEGVVRSIIKGAIRNNEDPYTFLSMALQETNMGSNDWEVDPFHAADSNPYPDVSVFTKEKDPESIVYQHVFDLWKDKKKLAQKLGKMSEEEMIQAWNGFGKITPKSNEYGTDSLYGIKLPIDFNANPIYGKRVIDLRENVIKKNPEIVKMVEEFKKFASEKSKR